MSVIGELEPRLVHMVAACRYTQRSRWTIARAVRSGELRAAGRNRRSMTFERTELDRWMIGASSTDATPPSAPKRAVEASAPSSNSSALSRIRRIAREGVL